MKADLFVIATRGRDGKEIYLKCSDKITRKGNIIMEWTEDINEAMATFTYSEIESVAKRYFKSFTRWYIREYSAQFSGGCV